MGNSERGAQLDPALMVAARSKRSRATSDLPSAASAPASQPMEVATRGFFDELIPFGRNLAHGGNIESPIIDGGKIEEKFGPAFPMFGRQLGQCAFQLRFCFRPHADLGPGAAAFASEFGNQSRLGESPGDDDGAGEERRFFAVSGDAA